MKARKIDRDGLLLCDLQGEAFELSLTAQDTSSEIFIRRFMHSSVAKELDNLRALQTNLHARDILARIDEEYGRSSYGSIKYTPNEIFWIGYIYRYFSYTYSLSSLQVYKMIKPGELRSLFLPYHTMDPAQAIDRILESEKYYTDEESELHRQYKIFRAIRMEMAEKRGEYKAGKDN